MIIHGISELDWWIKSRLQSSLIDRVLIYNPFSKLDFGSSLHYEKWIWIVNHYLAIDWQCKKSRMCLNLRDVIYWIPEWISRYYYNRQKIHVTSYLNESLSFECSPLSYLLLVRWIWPRVLLLVLTMTGMEFKDMLSKTPCLFMPKSILSSVPFDAEVFRLFLVMWLMLLLLLLLDTDWKLISESSSDGAMIVTPLDGSSSIGNPPSKWSPLLAAWKETLPNVCLRHMCFSISFDSHNTQRAKDCGPYKSACEMRILAL